MPPRYRESRRRRRQDREWKRETSNVEVSDPQLTGHNDGQRTSPDCGRVLDDARVISGIRLESTDDTEHAFKRPQTRLGLCSDYQPVRTLPAARTHTQQHAMFSFNSGTGRNDDLVTYSQVSRSFDYDILVLPNPSSQLLLSTADLISRNMHSVHMQLLQRHMQALHMIHKRRVLKLQILFANFVYTTRTYS